jgi:predicted transcriptional regulator
MSKQNLLLTHLKAGKEFTAKQITASFGLKNPHEAIRKLRSEGYCVYSNTKTLSTGVEATKYRIGTPTRAMVALAQAVAGAEAFTRA